MAQQVPFGEPIPVQEEPKYGNGHIRPIRRAYHEDRVDLDIKLLDCGDPQSALAAFANGENRPGVTAKATIRVGGNTLREIATGIEAMTKQFKGKNKS